MTALYVGGTAPNFPVTSGGVVVRMRLPAAHSFALSGKLTLLSTSASQATVTASLTSLDGQSVLDETMVSLLGDGASFCASLLGFMSTSTASEIVDIRFDKGGFTLSDCTLFALSVDAITEPGST
jgi:hypothetical protein